MAKPATEQEPARGSLDRAAFEALLKARGIALSTEEAESVFGLASWLNEGVAHLAEQFPMPAADQGDLADLSIAEVGMRLRNGQLTSVALIRAVLARIAERDKDYLSFYVVDAERALQAAHRADAELAAGRDRGPLHGIPVGI